MGRDSSIAVIGMAGRFPAADDIDEFWANLVEGRDCLSTMSDKELLAWGERPERLADPAYVRRRPRVDGAETFDAELFGLTPREAELQDPQHRLFFEVLHSALEHGGYDPVTYDGFIGVYSGANVSRYRYANVERNRQLVAAVGDLAVSIGGSPDYLTTYPSYKLGLRGPSMAVLTACSTSLVAVHVACNAIRSGDCDMALAGGVDLEFPLNLGYRYMTGGVDAADGVLRPFDKHATGTNFGNGAGAVLLKKLDAALADRDTVYAVIRGSALNNDGDRKVGFTAPSVTGQSECIQRALRNAGVDPRQVSYVEAHATATPVGDPIEMAGLMAAYQAVAGDTLPHQYCDIGTVKSNIGHLSQAAGIAGLIKTVLALWHEQIPPSINVETPNPAIDWESSPFRVVVSGKSWQRVPGKPRIAGVSSFGIGGTNVHAIVEEAPELEPVARSVRPAEAVLWSAVDEQVAQQQQARLTAHFERLPASVFPHAAHTLRVGRTIRKVRRAVVAREASDAVAALRDPARVLAHDGVERSVVFAFPGQGAQHPRMLRDLYEQEPVFRRGCDAAFERLASMTEIDLREVWRSGDGAALSQTIVAQPLLFTVEYALAHCLLHWGLRPRVLFGHSLGELVAAAVAGVFDFESGLRAVVARARLMQDAPPGGMVAVAVAPDDAAELAGQDCTVAAVNGKRQVVLAGPEEAMRALTDRLRSKELPFQALRTSHAFHTPAMVEAAGRWGEMLASLTLREPAIPVISAATGELLSGEEATSPEFWAGQLVRPVNFQAAATRVAGGGPSTIVEVGPGRTLTSLLRQRVDVRSRGTQVWGVAPASTDGSGHRLEELLARLWVGGETLTYWRDLAPSGYRRVAAPGYPYQRRRFWVEPDPSPAAEPATPARRETDPPDHTSWAISELEWYREGTGRPPGPLLRPPQGIAAVVGSPEHTGLLRSALGRAGYQTIALAGDDAFELTDDRQWTARLGRLAADGAVPDLVVHAPLLGAAPVLTAGSLDAELDRSVYSLYACAKAVVRLARAHRRTIQLLVLGRHLIDVSGGEAVNATAATAPAILRTLAREVPDVAVFCRDVAAGTPDDILGREIADLTEPLVALRGTARWLPRLRDLPVDTMPARTRLRYRGTYVITGGLGGIGLVVARALAQTGLEPRLALLGRSGLPADDTPAGRTAAAELAAIAALGAQVEVLRADVANPEQLASAVAIAERRFGPIHGVIHSAGVAGGGLLEFRDPADVRRVLAPKVRGVLNLEDLFADRSELDFMLLFSSQTAFTGLYGSADNAAGNAFLDAHSRSVSGRERWTLSVQWPAWARVGMAARSNIGIRALHGVVDPPADRAEVAERVALERLYRPGSAWEFDEHVADGRGVLPGTVLMELALLAARAGARFPAGEPLELRDVVFLELVQGAQPVDVRVLLEESGEAYRFRVQGRATGAGAAWVDHAQGSVRTVAGPPPGELDCIQRRLSRVNPPAASFAGWLNFGPRWQSITDTWGGADEALARLQLPAAFLDDLATHPLHPALVDTATAILHDVPPGRSCVPFLYRSVQVFAPLTADMFVHARFSDGSQASPRPTNLDFYEAKTGALLVRVVGFARREIDPAAGAVPAAPSGLLDEADGAAAFLALLSRSLPPVVMVVPPGERLHASGIPWADESAWAATPSVQPPSPPAGGSAGTGSPAAAVSGEGTGRAGGPATGGPDRADTTSVLRQLWMDVLGVPSVDDGDDFFELGGSSLVAVMLVNRIKERFGVDLGAGALFEYSTVDAIADELCRAQ